MSSGCGRSRILGPGRAIVSLRRPSRRLAIAGHRGLGGELRVLITGLTGMAGSHLAEYLLQRGDVDIYGTMRWRSRLDNLEDIQATGRLNTMEGLNITDPAQLRRHERPGAVNVIECDMC